MRAHYTRISLSFSLSLYFLSLTSRRHKKDAAVEHEMRSPKKPHATQTRKSRRRRLDILKLRTADLIPRPPAMSNLEDIRDSSGELVYGHVSMMGRRRAMEDAVTVAPPGWFAGEYYFFAVYDGHGGAKVAEKCGETMHECLAAHMEKARKLPEAERGFDWEKLMVDCFGDMDQEFSDAPSTGRDDVAHGETEQLYWRMGSTAVVVLVGKAEVVVANCGDSTAVLYRGGAVVPVSTDHKPDREDEKRRIEAAGGSVTNRNGWRVQGVLATSRSIGDYYLKPYVTSVPEVTVVNRSDSDEFMIIATDGLFDVICNDVACELVKKCLASGHNSRQAGASVAATLLAELAIAKGSKDNVSVIVVQLN